MHLRLGHEEESHKCRETSQPFPPPRFINCKPTYRHGWGQCGSGRDRRRNRRRYSRRSRHSRSWGWSRLWLNRGRQDSRGAGTDGSRIAGRRRRGRWLLLIHRFVWLRRWSFACRRLSLFAPPSLLARLAAGQTLLLFLLVGAEKKNQSEKKRKRKRGVMRLNASW